MPAALEAKEDDKSNLISKPGPHDVLLGRGGGTNNHAGNVTFRSLVSEHKRRYLAAPKVDKPKVAREVVKLWRALEPPGRFLARSNTGPATTRNEDALWYDVGDKKAREKASQCLRERTPEVRAFVQQLMEKKKGGGGGGGAVDPDTITSGSFPGGGGAAMPEQAAARSRRSSQTDAPDELDDFFARQQRQIDAQQAFLAQQGMGGSTTSSPGPMMSAHAMMSQMGGGMVGGADTSNRSMGSMYSLGSVNSLGMGSIGVPGGMRNLNTNMSGAGGVTSMPMPNMAQAQQQMMMQMNAMQQMSQMQMNAMQMQYMQQQQQMAAQAQAQAKAQAQAQAPMKSSGNGHMPTIPQSPSPTPLIHSSNSNAGSLNNSAHAIANGVPDSVPSSGNSMRTGVDRPAQQSAAAAPAAAAAAAVQPSLSDITPEMAAQFGIDPEMLAKLQAAAAAAASSKQNGNANPNTAATTAVSSQPQPSPPQSQLPRQEFDYVDELVDNGNGAVIHNTASHRMVRPASGGALDMAATLGMAPPGTSGTNLPAEEEGELTLEEYQRSLEEYISKEVGHIVVHSDDDGSDVEALPDSKSLSENSALMMMGEKQSSWLKNFHEVDDMDASFMSGSGSFNFDASTIGGMSRMSAEQQAQVQAAQQQSNKRRVPSSQRSLASNTTAEKSRGSYGGGGGRENPSMPPPALQGRGGDGTKAKSRKPRRRKQKVEIIRDRVAPIGENKTAHDTEEMSLFSDSSLFSTGLSTGMSIDEHTRASTVQSKSRGLRGDISIMSEMTDLSDQASKMSING